MDIKKCLNCNENIIPNPKSHSSSTRKYCSRKCYSKIRNKNLLTNGFKTRLKKGLSPESYPQWKGGKTTSKGYILIDRYYKQIPEHRLIAEKYLNRNLTKQEIIHHINGIKNDNCPKNLYLFFSRSEHYKYHQNPYKLNSNLLNNL